MGTAFDSHNQSHQKANEAYHLNEDAMNEILRLEVLENRRIQQIRTLRKITRADIHARR